MRTTHLVASELFLVLLLAGCANLPMDQDCRAGLENEFEVFDANGGQMRYHRSPDFLSHLSAAMDDELVGDYESCLNNIHMARVHRHGPTRSGSDFYHPTQNTYSQAGQNKINRGSANDAAHHAAGHSHHHGHD